LGGFLLDLILMSRINDPSEEIGTARVCYQVLEQDVKSVRGDVLNLP
jgi:hypothetical protein